MTYVPKGRPSWAAYGLMMAEAVALRADCRRMKVGAVIFSRDHRVVSTGYNGAPAGEPGCLAGHCPRGLLSTEEVAPLSSYDSGPGLCHAVHAEANALMYGDRERWQGGAMYTTYKPCPTCLKLIRGSGLVFAASTCGWFWTAGGDPDGESPVDQGDEEAGRGGQAPGSEGSSGVDEAGGPHPGGGSGDGGPGVGDPAVDASGGGADGGDHGGVARDSGDGRSIPFSSLIFGNVGIDDRDAYLRNFQRGVYCTRWCSGGSHIGHPH